MATWRVSSCTTRFRSWRRRPRFCCSARCGCEPASTEAELSQPLLSQRPKQLGITTVQRSDDALVQINDLLLLQHLQLNIRWEALQSPVFAERLITLTTTHAALSTAHVKLRDVAASALASKFPPGVPLAQSTPWEYLGPLNSLSSLAITSAPDLAQTATGRSFRNLHELDLPAGLSQLAMRTITLSSGAMPLHCPTLPMYTPLHPSDRRPHLTDNSRFRWYAVLCGGVHHCVTTAAARGGCGGHSCRGTEAQHSSLIQSHLNALLLWGDETLSAFTAREPAR